jgi:hypothetical protein
MQIIVLVKNIMRASLKEGVNTIEASYLREDTPAVIPTIDKK